jgi:hypothetical protein
MIGDNPYDEWKAAMMEVADRVAERASERAATRSSLVKLAHEALRVHVASLAGDVCPRDTTGDSEPLALAVAALKTAVRNKENSS